ncbi:Pyruvate kinase isozyme G [Hibiscus syriacus]|uniref:Pyruvate kinase n=1 Tax=Hibiscus syriacus TaxID=106335 RepID=A0A6A3CHV4_HIBSY|nr:Pyruvate kinase isozyme G [Hibiscus syriacus]
MTDKDWEDIKFGVDNQVDFYAVSFVKDAKVVHELKDYLKGCNADIHVIVKIQSADSIPKLHSIIFATDGAMVARGDLGAELPIEEVPLLQPLAYRKNDACLPLAGTPRDGLSNIPRVDENLVTEGESVTLVQSGARPICHHESTHHIQVRKIETMNL